MQCIRNFAQFISFFNIVLDISLVFVVLYFYDFNWYRESESEENIQAKKHFTRAKVDGRIIFELGDHAHVKVILCFYIFSCSSVYVLYDTRL